MSRDTDEELDLYASTSTDDSIVSRLAREVVTLRAARTEADLLRAKVAELEARALTADEVRAVVREEALLVLEDQAATVRRGDGVLLAGTVERRKSLVFCADIMASRVAEQLAGRVAAPHGGER